MDIQILYNGTNQGLDIIKLSYPQVDDSELELRPSKKFGQVWYVRGTDNKWYSPIDAYMIINRKNLKSKEQFKEAVHEIAKHFGFENDEEKNKSDSIIDESKIEELAKKFLRIGGKWYKKAKDPLTNQEALYPIQATMILADEGKEIGNKVLKAAPKYLAQTNLPSHINYQECVSNGDGEKFYNLYRPIKYSPIEGKWPHIEQLMRHIWDEQYEMGLDYFQLLFLKPLRKLPILLLVSTETGTGKSTFCNFISEIFGDNVTSMTNETLRSRFTAPWVSKLVVFVEETVLDKREDGEKIKNIVTAKQTPSESKGTDWKQVSTFVKVILCSNNEFNPVIIDASDSRYWVRKVLPLRKEGSKVNFWEECVKEIPAFLYFLLHRDMSTRNEDRLWFDPQKIRTEAWWRIVRGSEARLDSELRAMLLDIMNQQSVDTLKYDATSLADLCCVIGIDKRTKSSVTSTEIRNILSRWGVTASKLERFRYIWKYGPGPDSALEYKEKVGRPLIITREILQQNGHGESK